jgi:hypothetical protein
MAKPKKSKPKKSKRTTAAHEPAAPTRVQRWRDAVAKASVARGDLDEALDVLVEISEECAEWRDRMPDNLHGSATYEALDAICDIDIDRDATMTALDFIDEADVNDPPSGFGRD